MHIRLIFEFDEEEQDRLSVFVNAEQWKRVVEEMDNWLRNKIKYGDHKIDADEAYEECRKELRDILEGLSLEMFQ